MDLDSANGDIDSSAISLDKNMEYKEDVIDEALSGVTVLPKPWYSKESIVTAVKHLNSGVKFLFASRKESDRKVESCVEAQQLAETRIKSLELRLAAMEEKFAKMSANLSQSKVSKGIEVSEEQLKGQKEQTRLLDEGLSRLGARIDSHEAKISRVERDLKDTSVKIANGTISADQVVCKLSTIPTDPLSKRTAVTLGQALDKILSTQENSKVHLVEYIGEKVAHCASLDDFIDVSRGVKKVCANLDDLLQQFYEEGILDDPPPTITCGWEPATDHWASLEDEIIYRSESGKNTPSQTTKHNLAPKSTSDDIAEKRVQREMKVKEAQELAERERANRAEMFKLHLENTGGDDDEAKDTLTDIPKVINVVQKAIESKSGDSSEESRRSSRLANLLHKHRSKFKVSQKINEMHDTLEGQFNKVWNELIAVRKDVTECVNCVDAKADIATVELRIAIKFDEVINELESSLRKAGQDESYFKQAAAELFETCKELMTTKANKSEVVELRKRLMVSDKVSDQLQDVMGALQSKLGIQDAMELFGRTMSRAEMGPLLSRLHHDIKLSLAKDGDTMTVSRSAAPQGMKRNQNTSGGAHSFSSELATNRKVKVSTRGRSNSTLGPGGQSLGGGFQYRGNVNKQRPATTAPSTQRNVLQTGVEPHWSVGMLASPVLATSKTQERLPPVVKLDQGQTSGQHIYDKVGKGDSATPTPEGGHSDIAVEQASAVSPNPQPETPAGNAEEYVVTVPLKSLAPSF